jgi:hypothetical protein
MSGLDHQRNVEQFEERLRRWGGRPPSLAPAHAASRIVGRLPERGAATPWLRLAAVTAMLVLVAFTAWLGRPSGPDQAAIANLGSDQVVQFWLDSETPVYFVLPPFGGETGGNT